MKVSNHEKPHLESFTVLEPYFFPLLLLSIYTVLIQCLHLDFLMVPALGTIQGTAPATLNRNALTRADQMKEVVHLVLESVAFVR